MFKTLAHYNTKRTRGCAVVCLGAIFVALVFSYLYFLNQLVFNIAESDRLDSEIPVVNAELQQRTFEYISLKSEIDQEYAEARGFVSIEHVEYISREPLGHLYSGR